MSCVKKIIFFPHAGGLAYSYFKLARKVEENTGISTSVYEYAGRGERQKEAAFIDFKTAIESILQDIYKNFHVRLIKKVKKITPGIFAECSGSLFLVLIM